MFEEGWVLDDARQRDLDELMTWFQNAGQVASWGGPRFRFPFSRTSFRDDCHWPEMASFCLRDPDGSLCAFGQLYDRNGRINLARLIVKPNRRGEGIGRRLVKMLMSVGAGLLQLSEFSLFVFRDNLPALGCYRSLGFEITQYPADQILADQCYYLTRPVERPEDGIQDILGP